MPSQIPFAALQPFGRPGVPGNLDGAALSYFTTNVREITEPTYTIVPADSGSVLSFNSSTNFVVSVPGTLPVGFNCLLFQANTGTVALTYTNNAQNISNATGLNALNAYASLLVVSNPGGTAAKVLTTTLLETTPTSVAPTNVTLPTISGTPQSGNTLTATTGTWNNNPSAYSYQWFAGTTPRGTNSPNYTLVDADVGLTITVSVTASNSFVSATATSLPTAAVAAAGQAPGPVTSVTLSTPTSSSFVVTYTAASGATSHEARYSADGGVTYSSYTAIGTSPATLSGLLPSTNYVVQVRGVNATGAGTPGSGSGTTTTAISALLDGISVSAAIAYSTRKLRGSYAGAAIKVRRSSDNTTQDIGFDGSGNLDSVSLLAFVGGGGSGFVDTWYDQSGNAKHLTQAVTGSQPRIVNAGVVDTFATSGKAAVKPQSSGQVVTGSMTALANGAFTLNAVYGDSANTLANKVPLFIGGATLRNGCGLAINDNGGGDKYNFFVYGDGSATSVSAITAAPVQHVGVRSTTTTQNYINGVQDGAGSVDPTLDIQSTVKIGYVNDNAQWNTNPAQIGEVIVWASALGSTDRSALYSNQKSYWGTP